LKSLCSVVVALGLLGCADEGDAGPDARQCAEVARIYLRLSNPVQILGSPERTAEGRVEIRFRYVNDLNVPVESRAACRFAVDDAGTRRLLGAEFDGLELPESELDPIRQQLSAGGSP
jgi:hypothetical protein